MITTANPNNTSATAPPLAPGDQPHLQNDLLHELRNPLSVIQLTHRAVLDHLESASLPETDRRFLQELLANMESGIDQLRALIQPTRDPTDP